MISVVLLCAFLLFILWFEPTGESDLIYRVLGVLGIILASITIVTPVLHKLSSREDDLEKIDAEIARLKERTSILEEERTRYR